MIDIRNIPKILSIVHQAEIESFCKDINNIGNMKHFVFYAVFNNGQAFVLSNIFKMLVPYYTEKYYQQDYSFKKEIISNANYYLCDRVNSVSEDFSNILELKFKVSRAYYIIRNSPECQFVFGCIPHEKPDNFEAYYKNTIDKFEDFCVDFLDKSIHIIKKYNPSYSNSIILNDRTYRKSIIKTKNSPIIQLTKNELDVFYWVAYGKSAEETAIILNSEVDPKNWTR